MKNYLTIVFVIRLTKQMYERNRVVAELATRAFLNTIVFVVIEQQVLVGQIERHVERKAFD
jgi:hypothetical protein